MSPQTKKFLLRFDEATHRHLSDLAWAERKSMNQWLIDKINETEAPVKPVKPVKPVWVAVEPPAPDPEINERFAFADQPQLDFGEVEWEPEAETQNVDIPTVEF